MFQVFGIPFMREALVATLLLGGMSAYLSIYIVLKRIVFVGITLAQLCSAGVALAILTGWNATVCSMTAMLLGVMLFSIRPTRERVPKESFIGLAYAFSAALGMILISKSAQGETHLLNVLFGNVLAVTRQDVMIMVWTFSVVALIHALFYKEFIFVSFDPDMARTLGIPSRFWETLLYLTLGITIAVGIRVAGALLVFAFLVIPGLAGLLMADRLRWAFWVSIAVAAISSVFGLYWSFKYDVPSGACIVAVCAVAGIIAGLVGVVRRNLLGKVSLARELASQ